VYLDARRGSRLIVPNLTAAPFEIDYFTYTRFGGLMESAPSRTSALKNPAARGRGFDRVFEQVKRPGAQADTVLPVRS